MYTQYAMYHIHNDNDNRSIPSARSLPAKITPAKDSSTRRVREVPRGPLK